MSKAAKKDSAWHQLSTAAAAGRLQVDPATGLDSRECSRRRDNHGPNEIAHKSRQPLLRLFAEQFRDFMVIVLIAAAIVAGLLGELLDTIAILAIVLINALIGCIQQYRAERAMAALRRMASPNALVRRDNRVQTVDSAQLVPGDIVLLEAGNVVTADMRVIQAHELSVDEAILTGESLPVDLNTGALPDPELPVGDRHNIAFRGTTITRGRGVGAVIATGMSTEIGRIATLLRDTDTSRTPLQVRLARFGRRLAVVVLAICAVIFISGALRGEPLMLMFLTAVSLAVAAIPEALPAVVTASLAFGARIMARHRALVRRLPAVETLGSVTYVCADKTGTLTQNRMSVDCIYADGDRQDRLPTADSGSALWQLLGRAMAQSNDAEVENKGDISGDPTETALCRFAADAGFDKARLERAGPRIAELPFDSTRKLMTTIHRDGEGYTAFTKGAPEAVISRCESILTEAGAVPLDTSSLDAEADRMAADGYRVLAVAYREWSAIPDMDDSHVVEARLCFLGLIALVDPPREEAREAVEECLSAGVTPVMITGDHPATAMNMAARVGIADRTDEVLTGKDLARLTEKELQQAVRRVRVYARVDPEQKIEIVRALSSNGEYVAMTGDGVNDAPALKSADIGVAMGGRGTDVAREASDMVLLDDNFATIVTAIRQGRRIYDNIRKFVRYTMTSNAGELWVLFLPPFLGLPIPLLPIHILWINLVTDGLPGLALAAEPEETGIMRRPPRPPGESLFAGGNWQRMIWVGLLIGGLSIGSQGIAYWGGSDNWQTIVFTVLTFSQLANAIAVRSETESIFRIGLGGNRPLLAAVGLTAALQIAAIYAPPLQAVLKTQPLSAVELAACAVPAILVFFTLEADKWFVRRRGRQRR